MIKPKTCKGELPYKRQVAQITEMTMKPAMKFLALLQTLLADFTKHSNTPPLPYRKFKSLIPFHSIELSLQLHYQSSFLVSLKLCQEIQFKGCCFKIHGENKLNSVFWACCVPDLTTASTVLSSATSQRNWRVRWWMLWANLNSISLGNKSHCQSEFLSCLLRIVPRLQSWL